MNWKSEILEILRDLGIIQGKETGWIKISVRDGEIHSVTKNVSITVFRELLGNPTPNGNSQEPESGDGCQ